MTIVPWEPVRRDWLSIQNPALELANAIAGTDFVPAGLRNNPAAITAAILYGDEVGLGPMQSLAKIAVINGRPTLAAEAQRALILRAGHDLWVEESTAARCTVAGRRRDSEATSRVTWTLDDAKRANLSGKPPWKMYPRQMLLARASAELARAVFPDAIGGLAATEELNDDVDLGLDIDRERITANGNPPKTPTTRRKRASVTAGDAPPAPVPVPEPDEPPPLPPDEQALLDALVSTFDATPVDENVELMITDPQRKKMHALMREKDVRTREAKLAYCTSVLGRDIESSSDLTLEEAGRIIDHLEQYNPANPQTYPFPPGF